MVLPGCSGEEETWRNCIRGQILESGCCLKLRKTEGNVSDFNCAFLFDVACEHVAFLISGGVLEHEEGTKDLGFPALPSFCLLDQLICCLSLLQEEIHVGHSS